MGIFGPSKLSLSDAEDFKRILDFSSMKKQGGDPCLGPEGIQLILRALSKAQSEPVALDTMSYDKHSWALQESAMKIGNSVTLRKVAAGDIETCLKDVTWYAGSAQLERIQIAIEDEPNGASIYWGSKFFYLIKKLGKDEFAAYKLVNAPGAPTGGAGKG